MAVFFMYPLYRYHEWWYMMVVLFRCALSEHHCEECWQPWLPLTCMYMTSDWWLEWVSLWGVLTAMVAIDMYVHDIWLVTGVGIIVRSADSHGYHWHVCTWHLTGDWSGYHCEECWQPWLPLTCMYMTWLVTGVGIIVRSADSHGYHWHVCTWHLTGDWSGYHCEECWQPWLPLTCMYMTSDWWLEWVSLWGVLTAMVAIDMYVHGIWLVTGVGIIMRSADSHGCHWHVCIWLVTGVGIIVRSADSHGYHWHVCTWHMTGDWSGYHYEECWQPWLPLTCMYMTSDWWLEWVSLWGVLTAMVAIDMYVHDIWLVTGVGIIVRSADSHGCHWHVCTWHLTGDWSGYHCEECWQPWLPLTCMYMTGDWSGYHCEECWQPWLPLTCMYMAYDWWLEWVSLWGVLTAMVAIDMYVHDIWLVTGVGIIMRSADSHGRHWHVCTWHLTGDWSGYHYEECWQPWLPLTCMYMTGDWSGYHCEECWQPWLPLTCMYMAYDWWLEWVSLWGVLTAMVAIDMYVHDIWLVTGVGIIMRSADSHGRHWHVCTWHLTGDWSGYHCEECWQPWLPLTCMYMTSDWWLEWVSLWGVLTAMVAIDMYVYDWWLEWVSLWGVLTAMVTIDMYVHGIWLVTGVGIIMRSADSHGCHWHVCTWHLTGDWSGYHYEECWQPWSPLTCMYMTSDWWLEWVSLWGVLTAMVAIDMYVHDIWVVTGVGIIVRSADSHGCHWHVCIWLVTGVGIIVRSADSHGYHWHVCTWHMTGDWSGYHYEECWQPWLPLTCMYMTSDWWLEWVSLWGVLTAMVAIDMYVHDIWLVTRVSIIVRSADSCGCHWHACTWHLTGDWSGYHCEEYW